ncbi:hypothetical protein K2D_22600 [Planctomycetes bacterium K2D]|nr:hypothetical protein K2D_22600 [Planctomycetes bacterium K2D]
MRQDANHAKRPAPRCAEVARVELLRRWRVGIGVAGAFLFAAGVACLAVLLSPPARVNLIAVGADYAANLSVPHNAHGWRGLRGLCDYAVSTSDAFRGRSLLDAAAAPLVADDEFTWSDAVGLMEEPGALLLVSLHGGADEKGPYLQREACAPGEDPTRRLYVADLLHELRKLPTSLPKIVAFDATMSPGSLRYGEAGNEFAASLRSLNSEIEAIPGLLVVSSSDIGEQSWRYGDYGSTAFTESLLAALRGAANDTDSDGRLSIQEILAKVSSQLQQNATTIGRTQTVLRLPLGEIGLSRSRQVEIAIANPGYTPAPTPVARELPKAELLANWAGMAEVTAHLPNPESSSTLAWRRYRGLLIRREQLLTAGAIEAAQRVNDEIGDTQALLLEASHASDCCDGPVEANRAATGDPLRGLVTAAFAELWPAAGVNHHVVAARVFSEVPVSELPALRHGLLDRVVETVADDPQGRLLHGAALVEALHDPLTPLPAEAHLLSVLAEGLPSDLSAASWREALRLAIETRRLSTAPFTPESLDQLPYTAELFPWLQGGFAEADRARLKGEDLLFVGEPELQAAIVSLQKAKKLYEALLSDAQTVRRSLRVRDTAYNVLGFYTDATERLVATSPAIAEEIAEITNQAIVAHLAIGELSDILLSVEIGNRAPSIALQELTSKTEIASKAVEGLRDEFRHFRSRLLTRTGAPLELNREAALAVPDIEVAERIRLLSSVTPTVQSDVMESINGKEGIHHELEIGERSRRARLALAIVGRRVYERAVEGRDVYQDTVRAVTQDVDAANQATRACASLMISALNDSRALSEIVVDSGADEAHRQRVVRAAAALRRFAGAAAQNLPPSLLEEVRRVGRYDYLLWEAERSLSELWSDAQPGEGPRFQSLAMAYLGAADRLIPGRESTDRLAAVASQPLVWKLNAPASVNLVSSVAPAFSLKIEASDSPLGHDADGVAAVKLSIPEGYALIGAATNCRRGVAIQPGAGLAENAVVVGHTGDTVDIASQSDLRLSGWFRGSQFESTVTLRNLATPTAEFVDAPRRPGAGVAILDTRAEADNAADGAIAIVLDASGSMGPGDEAASKYRQAVVTLESLLRDLPTGVQVSVWVFGQAVGGDKTTDKPEGTIVRVIDPVRWNPADKAQLQDVMRELAYPRIEPWNESPLVRAMLMASRDLRSAAGYKSVIAITDGVDNRIAGDAYANPMNLPLDALMREELSGAGVSVQVIAFRVDVPEQTAARQQFSFLNQLSPAGRWWEASETSELERMLRQAFEESQTTPLYTASATALRGPAGVATVSNGLHPLTWPSAPVPEGVYDLPRLTNDATPQKALLSDGDLLLLAARQTTGGLYLSSKSFSANQPLTQPAIETAGWRAAVLCDRLLPNGDRSTLVCIEKQPDSQPMPMLKLERPAAVWFEASDDPAQRLRWRRLDGYPAPCWEVEWPAGSATGKLAVWWAKANAPTANVAVRPDLLRRELVDFVGHSWRLDGESIVLKRLAIETQRLPDARGEIVEQPCLVVELRGAIRCLTRLQGYSTAGQRQQWFDEAQASVATFWPVTAESLGGAVEGIELIAAATLKQQAESAGRTALFKEGPAPSTEDYRPIPVVDWFNTAPTGRPASDARRVEWSVR